MNLLTHDQHLSLLMTKDVMLHMKRKISDTEAFLEKSSLSLSIFAASQFCRRNGFGCIQADQVIASSWHPLLI